MRLSIQAPRDFSFKRTLRSHGWCLLAPFEADAAAERLDGVVGLPSGCAVSYRVTCRGDRVSVQSGPVPESTEADVRAALGKAVRRVLGLDLDLSEFHDRARECGDLSWIADRRVGRLLRCPTAWEDLVKLVLTTNCSWALTKKMVARAVELYGDPAPDGMQAFPRPERLARAGERGLRERVRTGYRAPHLAGLSRAVARGRIDPEMWEDSPSDSATLRKELLGQPGVGPYVADSMLKLLGRPTTGLAIDSALRAEYARVYHGGRSVKDRTIARRYARMGEWAGLALWCDMTREWLESAEASDAARSAGE